MLKKIDRKISQTAGNSPRLVPLKDATNTCHSRIFKYEMNAPTRLVSHQHPKKDIMASEPSIIDTETIDKPALIKNLESVPSVASELNYRFNDFASFEQAIKSPAVVSPRIGLQNDSNGNEGFNTASFKNLMKAQAIQTVEVDYSCSQSIV